MHSTRSPARGLTLGRSAEYAARRRAVRDLNEHAKRIIIKIDVELYETQILRGLITSGALCAGKVSDVLVEWDKIEIPARWWEFAAKRKAAAEQRRVDDEKRSIMWMLNSSACEHVHVGLWY